MAQTRELLAALAGEEDERELRVLRADRLQERDAVHVGEVVVADDTRDVGLRTEERESLARRLHRPDAEP
jgi:hypothetical protein